jgi:hypothetical protein
MGLIGYRGIGNRLRRVGPCGIKAGWGGAVACGGLKWRLESRACEGFWPDETRDLRARRSAIEGRGCRQRFLQRTVLVAVRAKQELGSGEPFDDMHGSAADWAVPERVGLIGGRRCGLSVR